MQAALECFRDSKDQVFLELDVQVVPCPPRVSCVSVEWAEVEGTHPPSMHSCTPSFKLPGREPWL